MENNIRMIFRIFFLGCCIKFVWVDQLTISFVLLCLCFLSFCLLQCQGQADLLKHAKSEALDTLRQIHYAAQSCGLNKNGAASPQLQHHPQHQPLQIQQQPPAKLHPQPHPFYQPKIQSQIPPQAHPHSHPLQYPQVHPPPPAPPTTQTDSKPPAYPQPPPLPQTHFQVHSQQQRAAGPLDPVPERDQETISDYPGGSCWLVACAHRESCPKRDRESETQRAMGVEGKKDSKPTEMESVAARVNEGAMVRKTRRVRSETRVWEVSWRRKNQFVSHFKQKASISASFFTTWATAGSCLNSVCVSLGSDVHMPPTLWVQALHHAGFLSHIFAFFFLVLIL